MTDISKVVTNGYGVFRSVSRNGKTEFSICNSIVKKAVIDQLVSEGRLKPHDDGLFSGFTQTYEYVETQYGEIN